MPVVAFRFEDMLAEANATAPVPAPIGDRISLVRSRSITSARGTSRTGAWECSPGRWRRQILQAEFCHFLEGDATFTPDVGEPIRLRAGDSAFFPEGSSGVWDVVEHSRKVFIIFNEGEAA